MSATLITAHTPEGYVVRRIRSDGEDAWRWCPDGSTHHCLDHKGPWIVSNRTLVPADVLRAFAKIAEHAL